MWTLRPGRLQPTRPTRPPLAVRSCGMPETSTRTFRLRAFASFNEGLTDVSKVSPQHVAGRRWLGSRPCPGSTSCSRCSTTSRARPRRCGRWTGRPSSPTGRERSTARSPSPAG
ncbi:hypothetical protein NOCA1210206 [metagenome]|uniref:Uncharacterized protein n=1 Tax=metagenome TaxID=256318 RepID=A0A2P2CF39_9ZZZZ